MELADKPMLAKMLGKVMSVYQRNITPDLVDVFYDALVRFDIDAIREGLNIHVQNPDAGQFPPKPADLVRYLEGGTADRGMKAWSRVDKALRQVGGYRSVAFDDPIVHKVLDEMGGWIKLCQTETDEDLKFYGIEFVKRYQSYTLRGGVGEDYPPYLFGIAEATNAKNGHEIEPPQLIGNPEQAAMVMAKADPTPLLRVTSGAKVSGLIAAASNHARENRSIGELVVCLAPKGD